MITFGDVPRPASPRLDAHDGTKAAGPEGSKKEEMLQLQLELHTKNIWSCCQVIFLAFQDDPCRHVSEIEEWQSLLVPTPFCASLAKRSR